jgi:hypothetical protein
MSPAVPIVCPGCHAYLPVAAERDQYSGEKEPVSDEIPAHVCEVEELIEEPF